MSNQGNVLRVNPAAFDQDYEYKRTVQYGTWQPGFILGAEVHRKGGKPNGSPSLKLIIGVMSTDRHPTSGKNQGAKIDMYVPLAGDRYKAAIACGDPESPKRYLAAFAAAKAQGLSDEQAAVPAGKAGETNLDKWTGKKIMVICSEEDDKLQSERTGQPVKRARIDEIAPAPVSGTSLI